uniref:Uncharacterized protein n=1 Tax=Odontella aurita TaxID=265563 RepID=A0A7S4I535_9STRA|mmetsp:Transcript_20106/g.58149  ORF Transcript_20106/g.58149 Transcript_20106/m.58149 type:complete len:261 (+) Transcript_20106:241-1023(+)|eukprot:CAMPEP_0113559378 /NCGR_PEP_ID=MMETSP0015_2-20120614/18866_1 /TAXON_ID=2838 /ORGANISM="Odontella" /LENGTH=260 /DNA_ID=CAMNT_0000461013 /DNA_START=223 /DNA_END=1005 /DNA_ORIENTATION=- /assembly_acc=CAM_ASM_000160
MVQSPATFASSTAAAIVPPAARLYSVQRAPPSAKIVHLVRHAEGLHNVSPDHKTPPFLDSPLTPQGIEQCRQLSSRTKDLNVEVVLSSPLTRCLQTAMYSYEAALSPEKTAGDAKYGVPLVAQEDWRETVNFLCDARRPTSELRLSFPSADFSCVTSESDPVWGEYETKFGCYKTHTGLRESNDGVSLERRVRAAWAAVADRPEMNVAVVSHSAIFMHMFTPYHDELKGVVTYEDDDVRELMTAEGFGNCEMRTVAFEAP